MDSILENMIKLKKKVQYWEEIWHQIHSTLVVVAVV